MLLRTQVPVDVDQRRDIGHHVEDIIRVNDIWRSGLITVLAASPRSSVGVVPGCSYQLSPSLGFYRLMLRRRVSRSLGCYHRHEFVLPQRDPQ